MGKSNERLDAILVYYYAYTDPLKMRNDWRRFIDIELYGLDEGSAGHYSIDEDNLSFWIEDPETDRKGPELTGKTHSFRKNIQQYTIEAEENATAEIRALIKSKRGETDRCAMKDQVLAQLDLIDHDLSGFDEYKEAYQIIQKSVGNLKQSTSNYFDHLQEIMLSRNFTAHVGKIEWDTDPEIFFAVISAFKKKGFIKLKDSNSAKASIDRLLYELFHVEMPGKSSTYKFSTFSNYCKTENSPR